VRVLLLAALAVTLGTLTAWAVAAAQAGTTRVAERLSAESLKSTTAHTSSHWRHGATQHSSHSFSALSAAALAT